MIKFVTDCLWKYIGLLKSIKIKAELSIQFALFLQTVIKNIISVLIFQGSTLLYINKL